MKRPRTQKWDTYALGQSVAAPEPRRPTWPPELAAAALAALDDLPRDEAEAVALRHGLDPRGPLSFERAAWLLGSHGSTATRERYRRGIAKLHAKLSAAG